MWSAEDLARFMHETYEELAPQYGYETREATRAQWENVPDPNRSLMIAVAQKVLDAVIREGQRDELHSLGVELNPLGELEQYPVDLSEESIDRLAAAVAERVVNAT